MVGLSAIAWPPPLDANYANSPAFQPAAPFTF